MKAKQLFANDAVPDADGMERYYAANIILQSKVLDIAMFMMQREPVWTRRIPTGATDGIYTYISPDYFLRLPTDGQRAFLLGHEGCHQILRHVLRAKAFRDRGYHSYRDGRQVGWNDRLWNIVGDKWINNYLISRGLEPIPEGIYDDAVTGKESVDQLYVKEWLEPPEPEDGGERDPSGEPDEDGEPEDIERGGYPGGESDGEDGDESGEDTDESADGSGSDPEVEDHGGWDYHLEPEYEGDEDQQAESREQDEAEIDREIEEAVKQAEQQHPGYGEGSVAGQAMAERTRELSSVNWAVELAEYIRDCAASGNDTSWTRIHRRRFAVYGTLNPTPIGQLNQMVLGVDISGSMTYNLGNVIAEVANAIDQINPVNGCMVLWFNHESVVQVDEVMTGQELLDVDKPPSWGAERPSLVLEYLEENGIFYDCLMIFSDGYLTYDPDDEWDLLAQAGALMILDQEPQDGWGYSPLPHIERTGIRYIVANDSE